MTYTSYILYMMAVVFPLTIFDYSGKQQTSNQVNTLNTFYSTAYQILQVRSIRKYKYRSTNTL